MRRALVLDTNVVLDLLVFDDPTVIDLKLALQSATVVWLATAAMRSEFERVLAYPRITQVLHRAGRPAIAAMACFDRLSQPVPQAVRAAVRCSDPDDQIFIDLAVAHHACLLSKDQAVLRLRKRLAVMGAMVQNAWDRS